MFACVASECAESDFFFLIKSIDEGHPLCVTQIAPFHAAEDVRRELTRMELVIGLESRDICSRSRRCSLRHVFQVFNSVVPCM